MSKEERQSKVRVNKIIKEFDKILIETEPTFAELELVLEHFKERLD